MTPLGEPLVSICIPHLGREQSLQRLLRLIPETAGWPHEIIVERDSFEDRQGCPRTLARAVEKSSGDFVAFLGNDTIPQPRWLRAAMECMFSTFPDWVGMVGLHDPMWGSSRCLHWVASKALLPMLGGEFFHTGYAHVGCDDELQARCAQAQKYAWCAGAVVGHEHFAAGAAMDVVYQLAWRAESVERDRKLLRERAESMGFSPWLPK